MFKNLYEVTGEMHVHDILDVLRALQKNTHDGLYISSNGGICNNFPVFANATKQRLFTALAGHSIDSLAVFVYLCANERYATPRTTFFFHRIFTNNNYTIPHLRASLALLKSVGEMYQGSIEFLEKLIAKGEETECALVRWCADRTRLTTDGVLRLMNDEATLDVRNAHYYGLVHKVIRT